LKEDADRALARAWGAKLDRDGVGERSEAPLREAARIAQPRRLIEHGDLRPNRPQRLRP
jgi:hypothetical protein